MTGLPPRLRPRAPVRTCPRLAGPLGSATTRRLPNPDGGRGASTPQPGAFPPTTAIGRLPAIPPPRTGRVKCGGVRAWSPYAADSAVRSCSERAPRPCEVLRDPLEIKCRRCGTINHLRATRPCPHFCTGIARPRSQACAREPFNSGWWAEGDALRAGWSSVAFSVDVRCGTPGWVCRCPFGDGSADGRS